jgi:hypothetical protein
MSDFLKAQREVLFEDLRAQGYEIFLDPHQPSIDVWVVDDRLVDQIPVSPPNKSIFPPLGSISMIRLSTWRMRQLMEAR